MPAGGGYASAFSRHLTWGYSTPHPSLRADLPLKGGGAGGENSEFMTGKRDGGHPHKVTSASR